ncbi:hypothetical protein WEB32_31385 [Streptomyces netropsis]|uniref:hypothetical protein n=1 Tax=Streptomyces netropsis TaxID=55404 RepID=UPI0030CE0615
MSSYPVRNALMRPLRRAAADRGEMDRVNLRSGQVAAPAGATHAAECLATLVADADRAPGPTVTSPA